MAAGRSLPIRKRMDDFFFASMAGLILLTVFIGFARTYYLAGMFHAPLPSLLVHVHGAMFSCWILLFIAQIALVSSNRIRWHMGFGIFGIILAVLMVLVGFATLIAVVRRHAVFRMGLDTLFAGDVLQLSTFALLVGWGFLARRDGPAHKRLMILGTVALLGPAAARWPFPFVFSSALVFFGLLDAIPILLIAFDFWSCRKIHRVTISGTLLLLAMQFSMRPLGHTAVWHRFTLWVQSL
jgi:hypothetical protein